MTAILSTGILDNKTYFWTFTLQEYYNSYLWQPKHYWARHIFTNIFGKWLNSDTHNLYYVLNSLGNLSEQHIALILFIFVFPVVKVKWHDVRSILHSL